MNSCHFNVPIVDFQYGEVIVLWPCDGDQMKNYLWDNFGIHQDDRNGWKGKCYFSEELDRKFGSPFALVALRDWAGCGGETMQKILFASNLSVFAHECFHAAEWMLKQSGLGPPVHQPNKDWESWEDAAYLLERIMKRALEQML